MQYSLVYSDTHCTLLSNNRHFKSTMNFVWHYVAGGVAVNVLMDSLAAVGSAHLVGCSSNMSVWNGDASRGYLCTESYVTI